MKIYLEQLQRPKDNEIDDKIKAIRDKYEKERRKLKRNKDSIIERLKEKITDFGEEVGREYLDELKDEIADQMQETQMKYYQRLAKLLAREKDEIEALRKIERAGKIAKYTTAGSIMAAIIITASYHSYIYFNKVARNKCVKYTGKRKMACLKLQRIEAMKKRLDIINKRTIDCNKSTDPYKCKVKIHKFSLELREKINDDLKEIGDSLGNWNVYK